MFGLAFGQQEGRTMISKKTVPRHRPLGFVMLRYVELCYRHNLKLFRVMIEMKKIFYFCDALCNEFKASIAVYRKTTPQIVGRNIFENLFLLKTLDAFVI